MGESVYKVIELVGTSSESWEKAARAAVEKASKSLRDLRVAEVVELDMQIADGKVENLPRKGQAFVQVRRLIRSRRERRLGAQRGGGMIGRRTTLDEGAVAMRNRNRFAEGAKIAVIGAAIASMSCTTDYVTGKRTFSLVSESQEIAMGREADPQIVAEYGLYDDRRAHAVRQSHRPDARRENRSGRTWPTRSVCSTAPWSTRSRCPGGTST
jgi:dodecin